MAPRALAVVTGGAGFIGSHMVDLLVGRGFRVNAIDNLVGGRAENLTQHSGNADVTLDERDIRSIGADDSVFAGARVRASTSLASATSCRRSSGRLSTCRSTCKAPCTRSRRRATLVSRSSSMPRPPPATAWPRSRLGRTIRLIRDIPTP